MHYPFLLPLYAVPLNHESNICISFFEVLARLTRPIWTHLHCCVCLKLLKLMMMDETDFHCVSQAVQTAILW
jgi:hypothetical protein